MTRRDLAAAVLETVLKLSSFTAPVRQHFKRRLRTESMRHDKP